MNGCSALDWEGTVVYRSKRGETTKSFAAMEWLAAMWSLISKNDRRQSAFLSRNNKGMTSSVVNKSRYMKYKQ